MPQLEWERRNREDLVKKRGGDSIRLERDEPSPDTTELDVLTGQRTEIEAELEMASRHPYLAGRIPGIEKRLDVVEADINGVMLARLASRLER